MELKAYLSGLWRLERQIEDARSGGNPSFLGDACFKQEGDDLAYVETGQLSMGEGKYHAERRMIWRFRNDTAGTVHFEDGSVFHEIAAAHLPQSPPIAVTHFCAPDQYEGSYHFSAQDRWTLEWSVSGPRKAYTSRSIYTRI